MKENISPASGKRIDTISARHNSSSASFVHWYSIVITITHGEGSRSDIPAT